MQSFHPMNVNVNTRMRWEILSGHPEFQNMQGKQVLDLAAGLGFFSLQFAKRGANVTASDIDAQSLEYLHREYGLQTLVLDIERDALPEQLYDLIFLGEVLEHIHDPQKLLMQLASHLAPQGLLVLTTPAQEGMFIHSAGKRLGHHEGSEKHVCDGFSHKELESMFAASKLKVVRYNSTIYLLSELFMQATKWFYLKKAKNYNGQVDVVRTTQSLSYKILCAVYPFLHAIFKVDEWIMPKLGMKGHCHMYTVQKA